MAFIERVFDTPATSYGWESNVHDDEVVHVAPDGASVDDTFISEYPCVDGFFIAYLILSGSDCTWPLFGPFPTFETAYAAWRLTK